METSALTAFRQTDAVSAPTIYMCKSAPNVCRIRSYITVEIICYVSLIAAPSGGYCDLPGQCLCREGYSGDNCAIGIKLVARQFPFSYMYTILYYTECPY